MTTQVGLYRTSRPVRKIFKIRTVRKPDVFLPGLLKFMFFKKATKIDKIFTVDLTLDLTIVQKEKWI